MKRRGFLALLGLGGTGLLIEKALPVGALVPAETASAPLVLPVGSKLLTPVWVAKEAAEAFHAELERLGHRWSFVPGENRLGDTVHVGLPVTVSRMRHVDSAWNYTDEAPRVVGDSDPYEEARERHIRPMAALLARDVYGHGMNVLTEQPMGLPMGLDHVSRATSNDMGVSVRVVRAYDPVFDREMCRFSVIGGHA